MKQKKEWTDEEALEWLEGAIVDCKKFKGEFQGLLARAEKENATESIVYIKETIIEINAQIKFFEAELKKRRIKKS